MIPHFDSCFGEQLVQWPNRKWTSFQGIPPNTTHHEDNSTGPPTEPAEFAETPRTWQPRWPFSEQLSLLHHYFCTLPNTTVILEASPKLEEIQTPCNLQHTVYTLCKDEKYLALLPTHTVHLPYKTKRNFKKQTKGLKQPTCCVLLDC